MKILLFTPLLLAGIFYRSKGKAIALTLVIPISYFLTDNINIYIIALSLILEIIISGFSNRLSRVIQLTNRVIILLGTLLALIDYTVISRFLIITLSIQFLLALFVALKFFSRNCFYIMPLSLLPITYYFEFYISLIYILITIGLISEISLKRVIEEKKSQKKLNEEQKRHLITTNLLTKIHDDILVGANSKTLLKKILETLNEFIGNDSSGIQIVNINDEIEFTSTQGFIPIHLKEVEQKDYLIENLEETRGSKLYDYTKNRREYISSIIILPIKTTSKLVGYLIIENNTFHKLLGREELVKARLFLSIIENAIESIDKNREITRTREIERDIEIASHIQRNLIPKEIKLPGGGISVITKAAKGMNGDYYTVLPLSNNRTLITICDVAGKGIPAAIVTVIVNTAITIVAPDIKNSSQLLESINKTLCNSVNIERYATICAMIIDPNNKTISFANGGHHPPIIKREDKLIELNGRGIPAGITPDSQFEEVTISYLKGDQIVLYTDGIIESINSNGEHFDSIGVKDCFSKDLSNIPIHFISSIFQKSQEHSSKNFNFDDRTIIGVKL